MYLSGVVHLVRGPSYESVFCFPFALSKDFCFGLTAVNHALGGGDLLSKGMPSVWGR